MAVVKGQGTLLQLSISAVFTTITQRVRVKLPDATRAKIETTDLDSTDETSMPGIRRAGTVEATLHWDPSVTTHAALLASYVNGVTEAWKCILADTGACDVSFSGWISKWDEGEAGTDGKIMVDFVIEITGAITTTP